MTLKKILNPNIEILNKFEIRKHSVVKELEYSTLLRTAPILYSKKLVKYLKLRLSEVFRCDSTCGLLYSFSFLREIFLICCQSFEAKNVSIMLKQFETIATFSLAKTERFSPRLRTNGEDIVRRGRNRSKADFVMKMHVVNHVKMKLIKTEFVPQIDLVRSVRQFYKGSFPPPKPPYGFTVNSDYI